MTEWPRPISEKLLDIVAAAYKGEVVIPEFQRSFIWTKKQVADLLVSILSGYFIGNFLALDCDEEEKPFPFRLTEGVKELNPNVETKKHHRIRYILDGQQRVTAVLYALYAPPIPLSGGKTPCQFFIDVEKLLTRKTGDSIPEDAITGIAVRPALTIEQAEKFVQEGRYLSFKLLGNQAAVLEWLWAKQTYLKTEENKRKLMSYITMVHEYPVPVISIGQGIGIEAIVDTFERINRTGTRLSTFDLLVALLYPQIKLRELWASLEQEASTALGLKTEDISDIIEAEYVAKVMSLIRGKSCKKTDILNLDKEKFEVDWDEAKNAIINTALRLKNVYGVTDLKRHVPYYAMLVPLAALLIKIEELGKSKTLYDKLDKWYWSSVFSERYESSADTYASGDFTDVNKWFTENIMPEWVGHVPDKLDAENLDNRDTRSAIYRGVMCLIALAGAKDFHTGQKPEIKNFQDDHVFPKSKYKDHREVDSILNRTLIDTTTNSTQIKGAKKPSEYLSLFTKELGDEEVLKEILKSHLIDALCYDALKKDDFETFLQKRQDNVLTAVKKKLTE